MDGKGISRRNQIKRRALLGPLIECQQNRCAVCQHEFRYNVKSIYHPYVIRLDRRLPCDYDNCVALCSSCTGHQANFNTVLEFYNSRFTIKNQHNKLKTDYATYILISDLVKNLCSESHIPYYEHFVSRKIPYIPPEKAKVVAESIFKSRLASYINSSHSRSKPENKISFSEAQNHCCCYCGYKFDFTEGKDDPRYFTWEHVIDNNDPEFERNNDYENLVIACSYCNRVRGRTHWSAIEFYEWAIKNLDLINNGAAAGWGSPYWHVVFSTQIYAHQNNRPWGITDKDNMAFPYIAMNHWNSWMA